MSPKRVISANAVAKDGCGLELKMFKDILLTAASFHLNSSVVLKLLKKIRSRGWVYTPLYASRVNKQVFQEQRKSSFGPRYG